MDTIFRRIPEEEARVPARVMNPVAALKTPGGSWLDWRSAWREMGRREEEIEAEAARREEEAAAQVFVKGAGTGSAQAARRNRARERLHGFTRARFDARCERTARLSAYVVKALLRGWRRNPLSPRELFNAAWKTCCGARLGSEAMARAWKDVWEWVRNIYCGLAGSRCCPSAGSAASDGVSARESKTERERPLKQCAPLTADAVCGLYGDFRESASPSSKGGAGGGNAAGAEPRERQSEARAEPAAGGTPARIPRFSGRLPGRACWAIWKRLDELEELHWPGTEMLWSEPHVFSWLKSCMAAGKNLAACRNAYYEAVVRWYGRRVTGEPTFLPGGMFAELYREAAAFPAFRGAGRQE